MRHVALVCYGQTAGRDLHVQRAARVPAHSHQQVPHLDLRVYRDDFMLIGGLMVLQASIMPSAVNHDA